MSINLPIVKVDQFVEIIEIQFNEGTKRPVFGLGKGGIGKTECIADLTKKLDIGYVDIRLLLYAETDLKGIPYPSVDHTRTIWLQNGILPTVENNGERGILVFDEITSTSRSVRTAAYQLLNERRLGEYVLPEGWMIVCLGNGEDDGGDFNGMEGNFINRCSVFSIIPDVESWKQWAFKNNVNYLVSAYVSWMQIHLHTYNPDNETNLLFASPRSWKAVSDILNTHPFDKNDEISALRIISNLGTEVGNNFLSFCKFKEVAIDPLDILKGKVIGFSGDSIEVLFMTMQGVVKLVSDATKIDINNSGDISATTFGYWINAVNWMISLEKLEHKVMGIKDMLKSNEGVASKLFLSTEFTKKCPKLREFVSNNSEIFKN